MSVFSMRSFVPLSFFLMLVFSVVLVFVPSVPASTSAYHLLSDWDDVASGVNDSNVLGTPSGVFDFAGQLYSDYFATSNAEYNSSDNGFRIRSSNTVKTTGVWNVTDYVSSVDEFGFAFHMNCKSDTENIIMHVNDSDDNAHLVLRFNDTVGQGAESVWFYKVDVGYTLISRVNSSTWYYMIVEHKGTNQFKYSIYNASSGLLVGSAEGAGSYAGTFYNFDNFWFEAVSGAGDSGTVYFDDVYYVGIGADPSEDLPELDGYTVTVNDVEGLSQDFCLGSTYYFEVTAVGDAGCKMCIYIYKGDDWIYGVCSMASPYGFYYTFSHTGTYAFTVVDALGGGFSSNIDFDVVDCGAVVNYTDVYGDFFVEFYNDGSDCPYSNGEHPEVCYDIGDYLNYSTANGRFHAYINIVSAGPFSGVVDKFIVYNDTVAFRKTIFSTTFSNGATYEIHVYNTTFNAVSGYSDDSLVYVSQPIGICNNEIDSDGDGVPDYLDDEPFNPDSSGDTSLYEWIAGFGLVVGFACFPIFVFHNNQFAVHNGVYIMAFFGLIGLGIAIYYELLDIWLAYIVGLLMVAFFVYKVLDSR